MLQERKALCTLAVAAVLLAWWAWRKPSTAPIYHENELVQAPGYAESEEARRQRAEIGAILDRTRIEISGDYVDVVDVLRSCHSESGVTFVFRPSRAAGTSPRPKLRLTPGPYTARAFLRPARRTSLPSSLAMCRSKSKSNQTTNPNKRNLCRFRVQSAGGSIPRVMKTVSASP